MPKDGTEYFVAFFENLFGALLIDAIEGLHTAHSLFENDASIKELSKNGFCRVIGKISGDANA